MNIFWRSLASAVLAVGFLVLVGYLEIRGNMLELGLVLSWDLQPLRVTEPQVAVLELSLIFLAFAAVALLFLMAPRGLSGRTAIPALVGGLTLLVLGIWHMVTVDHAVQVPADLNEFGDDFGWATVFETGALSSTTHGMAALLLSIALLKLIQARGRRKSISSATVTTS